MDVLNKGEEVVSFGKEGWEMTLEELISKLGGNCRSVGEV
jgi:hypothetical protein